MKAANLQKRQIDLIKESMCVYTKCTECTDLYRNGKLCFSTIEDFVDDRGKSCLFRLKEMSHELFRNEDDATYKERLYDITVGYIFHEAMKLRENLYQLEYYKPRQELSSQDLTTVEKKLVREIEALVGKAEKKMKEGFKEIKVLLADLLSQMRDLMKLYKDNYLLPRFIYEQERRFLRILGRKGYEEFLNDLYGGGRTVLMMKAALSYLDSEYYEDARLLMKRVFNLDNGNRAAQFLYHYASGYYFFYKNMPSRALRYAQQAHNLKFKDFEIAPVYVESLDRLLLNLSEEVKKADRG
jgi:hypothetical protein